MEYTTNFVSCWQNIAHPLYETKNGLINFTEKLLTV